MKQLTRKHDRPARHWRTRAVDPRIQDELRVIAEHHEARRRDDEAPISHP